MRLTGDPAPGTMNSSSGSGNFLLVPIPEYPLLDCVPNKTVKIVVLGASNVGKTGMDVWRNFIGAFSGKMKEFIWMREVFKLKFSSCLAGIVVGNAGIPRVPTR